MSQLSKHFSEAEFLRSATAIERGIKNTWQNEQHKQNAIKLCEEVLEPLRAKFGALKITSGYRTQELNKIVGGASQSKHLTGEAADIVPLHTGVRLQEIYEYLNPTHNGGLAMKKGLFIHIDIGNKRRWTY
jgi:uncharacterized protein YcbK (DUF882 family)